MRTATVICVGIFLMTPGLFGAALPMMGQVVDSQTWRAMSLPWLILADAGHVARAEGLTTDELETQIEKMQGSGP